MCAEIRGRAVQDEADVFFEGTAGEDPEQFDAPPSIAAVSSPISLKICAIDDSRMICKGYERILLKQIGASRTSSVCCPESEKDVDEFLHEASGTRKIENCTPADIVLLDQNIDLRASPKNCIRGADLAVGLRSRGYHRMVVIRSANSSVKDHTTYMSSGDVDLCIGAV